MSARIAIVTDSTSDIPKDIARERGIYVVPLHIMWGTETLRDGVDITTEQFYERLAIEPELPTTSQPTPTEFADAFQQARDETDAEGILVLTISADLSGTYSSAVQAVKMVDFPVRVVDTRVTSLGQTLCVLEAADARDQGASLEEAAALAESLVGRTLVIFTVNTLEYLHKGGRIGGAQRLIGTALNIKPILHVVNGRVEARESIRTRKRALRRLVEIFNEVVDPTRPLKVGVLHGQSADETHEMENVITTRYRPESVITAPVGCAIGTHTGPGVVGFTILQ